MKKIIVLLLASLMTISLLSACGGEEEQPKTSEGQNTEEKTAQITEMDINSVIETDNYDFSVIDFYFSDRANDPDNESTALLARKGYCFANIVFDAKYKGKQDAYFPNSFGYCKLNYGDGYTFDSEKDWFYDTSLEGWLNMGDIRTLMPNFRIAYNFEVPLEVRDNSENPLSIILNQNGNTYEFNFRPMSDESVVEYSKIAESLMNNGYVTKASEYYQELNNYGDFSSESENANLYKYIYASMAGKSGDAWEYFQSHQGEYPNVSGEEISEIFKGNWYGFNTSRVWTIYEDGSIDDGFDYQKGGYGDFKRSWWLDGDTLAITGLSSNGSTQTHYYTVKKIDDNSYLLIEDGIVAASMTNKIP